MILSVNKDINKIVFVMVIGCVFFATRAKFLNVT
jgi:hypothetical protein